MTACGGVLKMLRKSGLKGCDFDVLDQAKVWKGSSKSRFSAFQKTESKRLPCWYHVGSKSATRERERDGTNRSEKNAPKTQTRPYVQAGRLPDSLSRVPAFQIKQEAIITATIGDTQQHLEKLLINVRFLKRSLSHVTFILGCFV